MLTTFNVHQVPIMPQIGNLVSKKFDGVTDVTFAAIQPAAGDGSYAIYQDTSVGNSFGTRPMLQYSVSWNAARTVRKAKIVGRFPQLYTDTATGLMKVANTLPIETIVQIPVAMPEELVKDYVASYFQALIPAAGSLISGVATGQAMT